MGPGRSEGRPAPASLTAFLNELTDYERERRVRYTREAFDLQRMRRLLAALGDPHRGTPTVHIAGSKGKGSTATLVEQLLRASQLRTGLYTSPHLTRLGERIAVDGVAATEAGLERTFEQVEPALRALVDDGAGVTFFEVLTAIMFVHVRAASVEALVLEVGLGGRLDATNVVEPEVTVVTGIGLEHEAILGRGLARIAAEKAGILKEGVPCVTGPMPPEALEVTRRVARERGAPLIEASLAVAARDVEVGPAGTRASLVTPSRCLQGVSLGLHGVHMAWNAAVAVAATDLFIARTGGSALPDERVREVLRQARMPGRFEIRPGSPEIVLDAAHTAESMEKLAATFRAVFPGRGAVLVVGVLGEKDLEGLLAPFADLAHSVCAAPCGSPREVDPGLVAEAATRLGLAASAFPDAGSALGAAREAARSAGAVVLACGSIYLLGLLTGIIEWQASAGTPGVGPG